MNKNCEIIKDLMPIYCDGICSEASKAAVEEHTSECAECFEKLKKMKKESVRIITDSDEEKANKKVIKKVKRKIIVKRIIAVFAAVVITAAAGLFTAIKIFESKPVEYFDGIADAYVNEEGNPIVKIYVDGYDNCISRPAVITENGEEKNIICMFAFSTVWDKIQNEGNVYEEKFDITYNGVFGRKECDAIYYYIWDNPMFEEIPDFESVLKEKGNLIWDDSE